MYEENSSNFSWLSLFIKVVIFVVFVLLAIWLISKVTLRGGSGDVTFDNNLATMKTAASEYFIKNGLPSELGSTKKVTLEKLISDKLIKKGMEANGKVCNTKKSYAEVTKMTDYYAIKVELTCGDKTDYIYGSIESSDCKDCDNQVVDNNQTNNSSTNTNNVNNNTNNNTNSNTSTQNNSTNTQNNNTSNNNTNTNNNSNNNTNNNTNNNENNNQNSKKKTYYEYVKYTYEYSDWYVGNKTGSDIQNSTRKVSYATFCNKVINKYYTMSYVNKNLVTKNGYSYKINNIKVIGNSYFKDISYYNNYINNRDKNLSIVGGNSNYNVSNVTASKMKSSALTANNFTYSISSISSKNGRYYVDITINIKNTNGISAYYSSQVKSDIYFVPVYFSVQFTDMSSCVEDLSSNVFNYGNVQILDEWDKTENIYRYVTKKVVDTKWSTETSLKGYEKTGNTKLA